MITRAAEIPYLARSTKKTMIPSVYSPMNKIRIPASPDKLKTPTNIFFGLNLASKKPEERQPSISAVKEPN